MAANDDAAGFLSLPECAALLSSSNIVWEVPGSRTTKEDSEDSLFALTLKTFRSLSNCVIFYPKPTSRQTASEFRQNPKLLIPDLGMLVRIGDGLNGFPEVLHGGIIATLIDESMGMLHTVNKRLASEDPTTSELSYWSPYTVELKVRYLQPVVTPGVVFLDTRTVKFDGRKHWLSAEVKQYVKGKTSEQTGQWTVCGTGEALFVAPKKKESKI